MEQQKQILKLSLNEFKEKTNIVDILTRKYAKSMSGAKIPLHVIDDSISLLHSNMSQFSNWQNTVLKELVMVAPRQSVVLINDSNTKKMAKSTESKKNEGNPVTLYREYIHKLMDNIDKTIDKQIMNWNDPSVANAVNNELKEFQQTIQNLSLTDFERLTNAPTLVVNALRSLHPPDTHFSSKQYEQTLKALYEFATDASLYDNWNTNGLNLLTWWTLKGKSSNDKTKVTAYYTIRIYCYFLHLHHTCFIFICTDL